MSKDILPGKIRMRRWMVLAGGLALLLLLRGPALMSAVWSNAGMLMLRDGLLAQADFAPGIYPVYEALGETLTTARAMRSLRRAVPLNEDSLPARWALGRAALAVGDAKTAANALSALADKVGHNPFLYHDVLTAFSYDGWHENVIALYESSFPPQHTQPMSDAVALAYLEEARGAEGQGSRRMLERARELRPGDLYTNYSLWQQIQEVGDIEAAAVCSDKLTYFPLEAIHPTDERLLIYAAEVVPALLEAGLWDREKTMNVISFLVWQHNGALGVERLLEQLIERYPTEPNWPFYLAELYHRRGDLERAEVAYRQVPAVDREYAQAYLRLGMVAEAKSQIPNPKSQAQLKEAQGWYEHYHETAPDDLLGLKRLAEVCAALEEAGVEDESCREAALRASGFTSQVEGNSETLDLKLETSPAAVLQKALEARTDDRRIVAGLLGVPVEDVGLGPNLVENGGFEEWVEERPERWMWSAMFNREPFNAAAFARGADGLLSFEGQRAARIDGYWVQQRDNKSSARAGFWQWDEDEWALRPITLTMSMPYVLSFCYRTTRVSEGGVRVWVSYDPDILWAGDLGLPATNGAWGCFSAVGWNLSGVEAAIYPLIRSFSSGSVEFDDVQVRPIWLPEGVILDDRETRFWALQEDKWLKLWDYNRVSRSYLVGPVDP